MAVPYTYLRRIDGRLYDESGVEYDEDHRPFLRKSPQAEAAFKKLQEEARKRSVTGVRKTDDQKAHEKTVGALNTKIAKLRETAFHTKCHQDFYRSLLKPDILTTWLDDIDSNLAELLAYRNHLLDRLCIAEEMVTELDKTYLDLNDEIDKLEEQRREENARTKGPSNATTKAKEAETPASRAKKLLASLPASLIQQWIAAGLDPEKLAAGFTGS